MKNLYALLALSAVCSCNARNPFDSLFEEMKHLEQRIEEAFHNRIKGDYHPGLIDLSIKDDGSTVNLIVKVNGIEKEQVNVQAHEGVLTAVIPTKEGGKTTIQANKHAVTVFSEQQVTHETKDATGKVLSTSKSNAISSQTQPLPSHVDVMNVIKVEVSDDSVTIILGKEEAKKIPVTIV